MRLLSTILWQWWCGVTWWHDLTDGDKRQHCSHHWSCSGEQWCWQWQWWCWNKWRENMNFIAFIIITDWVETKVFPLFSPGSTNQSSNLSMFWSSQEEILHHLIQTLLVFVYQFVWVQDMASHSNSLCISCSQMMVSLEDSETPPNHLHLHQDHYYFSSSSFFFSFPLILWCWGRSRCW